MKKKVAFQGIPGSFSSIAARTLFGESLSPVHTTKFRQIFEAVAHGEAQYGVVPLENTLAGSIHENYDLLGEYRCWIAAECYCLVQLHLLCTGPLEGVERVFSHPKALEQCSRFLREHDSFATEPWSDTAGAAQHVAHAHKTTWGAIASEEAATLYGLPIVARSIQDHSDNKTRFVAITHRPVTVTLPSKASLMVTLPHEPGSLQQLLRAASDMQMNLTKIETRPRSGKPFEYSFYVDLTSSPKSPDEWRRSLQTLQQHAQEVRLLGLYEHQR